MRYLLISKSSLLLALVALLIAGCTLSTTGLRAPKDHSLARGAITEVYDKPPRVAAAPKPAPAPMAVCQAPALPATEANFSGCKSGDKIVLAGLNFNVADSTLSAVGSQLLDMVAVGLKGFPQLTFAIGGHTDNTGEAGYNQELSEKRAKTVMQYLLSSGIAAERMTVNGYGETAPIAENSSPDGRFLNRRVELVVTGTGFLGSAAPVTDTHEHSYVMKKGAPERASSVPADGASMGIATISIVDNAFKPSLLTVPVGTKVTWVNNGGSNHKISFTSGMGPRMRSGAAYEKTFDVAGEYAYECAIHGARMNGKIIVTE